jgi:glycerophosphoryl diester phosphodiesterase
LNLFRDGRRPLVTGHRGAAALAPENTLASFAAAVEAGADLVEFDIGADLILAHSPAEVPDEPASLDDALDFLHGHGTGVHVDVKHIGIEPQVVDALRRHGLAERAVVSAAFAQSVRRVAAAAPELPRAIGYPRDRFGVTDLRWPGALTTASAAALRAAMPLRVPLLLRVARANVLSLHCALVSRATVATAHALGAPVIAWTANDPRLIRRLVAAGVDAIVSDDPRMVFETLATLNSP